MTKRSCAVVSTTALRHNLEEIIKKAKGKEVVAVIKADGYGHGAVKLAKILSRATSFAVATAEEALELRKAEIIKDILILAPVPLEDSKECIENNIILTVSDYSECLKLNALALEMKRKARVHVALDTGMTRVGFLPSKESKEEILGISKLEWISLEGIFSHYARADEKDKSSMNSQRKLFFQFTDELKESGIVLKRHLANSASIMDSDEFSEDAVRAGIILYGLYPSDEVMKNNIDIIPALTWKSRVSTIREVKKGQGISYGHTYVAEKDMKVATVSTGYGDGYPRVLSGKGRVLINGKSFPVLGRVCMDQFMVDVTGADVKIDDEVILIGKSGNEQITADEIAKIAKTINYEIVCNINKRVKRIYE